MTKEYNHIAEEQLKAIHVIVGKTLQEYQDQYGNNEDLWDVSIEDIESGAIEPNEDCYYWLINGRLYETDIEVK